MSSLRTEKGIQNLEEQGYLLFSDKYLLGSTQSVNKKVRAPHGENMLTLNGLVDCSRWQMVRRWSYK